MANSPNKKSFNVINVFSKSFDLIVTGFQFATSLFMRLRFKIPISFNGSAISKISLVLRLRRIRLISQVKLVTKPTWTLNLRRVRFLMSMRQIGKIITTINLKMPIIFSSKSIQKMVTLIRLRRIIISASPTIATFFRLGDYDPDTLGTLDGETLGDLDYVVA